MRFFAVQLCCMGKKRRSFFVIHVILKNIEGEWWSVIILCQPWTTFRRRIAEVKAKFLRATTTIQFFVVVQLEQISNSPWRVRELSRGREREREMLHKTHNKHQLLHLIASNYSLHSRVCPSALQIPCNYSDCLVINKSHELILCTRNLFTPDSIGMKNELENKSLYMGHEIAQFMLCWRLAHNTQSPWLSTSRESLTFPLIS